jgi:two-component system response regulator DesR
MNRISLVLVDNRPSARDGIVALMSTQPGFQVLAASAKLGAAMEQVREDKPNLVLLHLRPPGDEGLKVAGALHGESPETRVIIVGLEPLHENLAGFVRAGVSGFIMGNAPMDRFLSSLRSVARGIQVLPPELTRALFSQLRHGDRKRPSRTPDSNRLRGYGRVEVAAWSLQ